MMHPAVRLTRDERNVLTLLDHCDKSVADIAIILKLPLKTIEERVADGTAKLHALAHGLN